MPPSKGLLRYAIDIAKVLPGDILLSRIPMNLRDESTWDSHLVQTLTRSRFSFAALYVADGLFAEAVGSGVARLPLWKAGIRDKPNVRVLRARKDYRWAAIGAAACGLNYLEQGFYRPGLPKPKCTAFHDLCRAASIHAGMIASAYATAGLALDTVKPSGVTFAGGFTESVYFEDVTDQVVQRAAFPHKEDFNLDDESLRNRICHWEVETQLKILCKQEVRRILELKSAKPSSLAELELLLAKNQWRSLDSALHHALQWYRYDKLYRSKQNQLLANCALLAAVEHDAIAEELFDGDIAENDEFKLLEMEANYCRKQRDRYKDLMSVYKAASFSYLHDLFSSQEVRISGAIGTIHDNQYSSLRHIDVLTSYLPARLRKENSYTHKMYEVN